MAKVISLFNHKGGVSKTTTAFNLGWMLATKNKRVLLVDCDPQCNLTGMILGYVDFNIVPKNNKNTPTNLKEGLAPAFESRPKMLEAVECIQVKGNENLYLLPGNIGLAEYEVTLGVAQTLSSTLQTLRNLPGSISHLIKITAEKYKIDYVLVDMSPSLGAVNQNLLMTSDYFLVPTNPDFFSTQAIESLAKVLPRWKDWSEQAKTLIELKEAEYPYPDKNPKFLGAIIQNYRISRDQEPAKAFKNWIDELLNGIKNILLPNLISKNMVLENYIYKKFDVNIEEPILQMPNFNSLIAWSQKLNRPVFDLNEDELNQKGAVWGKSEAKMKELKSFFSDAADKIIGLTDEASH